MIEYQCTRSGIRNLLTRSINNSPSNLAVDEATGTFVFRSTAGGAIIDDVPVPAEVPVKRINVAPPPVANRVVVVKPPVKPSVTEPKAAVVVPVQPCLPPADGAAERLIRFMCPTGAIDSVLRQQLIDLMPTLADRIGAVLVEKGPDSERLRAELLKLAIKN